MHAHGCGSGDQGGVIRVIAWGGFYGMGGGMATRRKPCGQRTGSGNKTGRGSIRIHRSTISRALFAIGKTGSQADPALQGFSVAWIVRLGSGVGAVLEETSGNPSDLLNGGD